MEYLSDCLDNLPSGLVIGLGIAIFIFICVFVTDDYNWQKANIEESMAIEQDIQLQIEELEGWYNED